LGIVRVLREKIASYVTKGIERVRALREAVRLTDEPVEVKGRIWRDPLQAHLCVHLGHSRGSLDGSLIKGAGLPLRGCVGRFVAHQSLSAPFDITLMRFREGTDKFYLRPMGSVFGHDTRHRCRTGLFLQSISIP
jgi:hypothetical protein